MATKIQLTPAELKAQAAEMRALNEEYTSLFSSFSSELKSVNGNWSTNLANNFVGKISVAQNSFKMISIELANGAKVADNCANTFTTVDAELAKVYPSSSGGRAVSVNASANAVPQKPTPDELADLLSGDWIDKEFPNLPQSAREHLKKVLELIGEKLYGDDITDINSILAEVARGDYVEALKEAAKMIYCGKPGFFANLDGEFYINSVFGMLEEYGDYCKDPSLINLLNIGWSGTVGSVLETVSDKSWGFVKYIPGISEWYEKHGATDGASAFNVMYRESMRAIFGDDMAEYCGSYYEKNGGLFGGLVNGFKEIGGYIGEKSGGIVEVWKSGWNSIFGG